LHREPEDRLLAENAGRASRERLTLMRLFEVLRGLGYEGGYDTVRRYARGLVAVPHLDGGRGLRAAELRDKTRPR
jgi:hypothetical protein